MKFRSKFICRAGRFIAVLILSAAMAFTACGGSKKTINSSSDLILPEVSEMKSGMYIGGGLLYNSQNDAYNHFSDLSVIPVRLSTLKKTDVAEDVTSTEYSETTGEITSQTTTSSLSKTSEIAESVHVGQIGVKKLDDAGITLAYKLVDINGATVSQSDDAQILLGAGIDLDKDGYNDVEYMDFDPDNEIGLKGTKILRFISDETALNVTMYQTSTESEYKFPSGIMTVTPSYNFIIKLSNLTVESTTDETIDNITYKCFTLNNSDLPVITQYDYLYDDTNSKMYLIMKTPEKGENSTKFSCVEYETFRAFEYANVKFTGTSDPLKSAKNSFHMKYSTREDPEKSVSIPIVGMEWKYDFFNNSSGSLSASIDNDMSLFVDADFNICSSSITLRTTILFVGNSAFSLNGTISKSYSKTYSQTITPLRIPVFIGAVFVGNFQLPIEYGVNAKVAGFGSLATSVSLNGQFGFNSETGLEVRFKTYSFFRKKVKIPIGLDFYANADRVCNMNYSKTLDIGLRGSASFTPFIKIAGEFALFGIAGCNINEVSSISNTLTANLDPLDASSSKVEYKTTGDISLGAELVVRVNLLYWSKTLSKPLGKISVWNKELYNDTYSFKNPENPFTLKYNGNGKTGGVVPSSAIYKEGQAITAPGGLTKSGFIFAGWTINGAGTPYTPGQTFLMPAGDTEMFASWGVIPPAPFTLTYNGNGSNGGIVPASSTFDAGNSVTIAAGVPTKTGNTFGGWVNGLGTLYMPGQEFAMFFSNTTLTAVWNAIPRYIVQYSGNGNTGGYVPSPGSYLSGNTVTVSGNTELLTKSGSVFGGWNTNADGSGISYSPGAAFNMPSGDVTLNAVWNPLPQYTITYNGNGSTSGNVPAQGVYSEGEAVTLSNNTGFLSKKVSYFDGWNTKADGSGTFYSAGESAEFGTGNVILYAVYGEITANNDMVFVPGGIFNQMTQMAGFDANFEFYMVMTSTAFYHTISSFQMSKYEVTYEFWFGIYRWAISNGYSFANPGAEGSEGIPGANPTDSKNEPVTTVGWRDAIVWCNAYSEFMGLVPVYYTDSGYTSVLRDSTDTGNTYEYTVNTTPGSFDNPYVKWNANGYRLPTNGEWQYAASWKWGDSSNGAVEYPPGTGKYWTPYNYGSGGALGFLLASDQASQIENSFNGFDTIAWFGSSLSVPPTGNASKTHNVGGKAPNKLGIFDMSGNVYEWCWDWLSNTYPASSTDYHGAQSGNYDYRVIRGGNWSEFPVPLQVGFVTGKRVTSAGEGTGFRLVRSN